MRSSHRGTLRLTLVLGGLVLINLYVFLWRDGTAIPDVMEKAAVAGTQSPGAESPAEVAGSAITGAVGSDGAEIAATPKEAVWRQGKVQKGDSLGQILRRDGLAGEAADEVIRAINEHLDFKSIRVGQKYRLQIDQYGRLQGFEFSVSKVTTVRAIRDASGKLVGEKLEAPTETRVMEIGGTIQNSLYMAFKARGSEDTKLVSFFIDVFAYDLNFFIDQHKGDNFRVIVEKEYLDGKFLRHGRILAAEYSGKAGTYRAFWWTPPGSDRGKYYDEEGRGLERTFLKTPLKYTRISSKFDKNRMHPVLHRRRAHLGVDFAAPTGTPIRAAADGTIVQRGDCGGAGNCVVLRHANGLSSIYMHMSKFQKGQRHGQKVRAKDVIGFVGMTGLASGPHLHFGVKKNGKYIDPMKLKMERVLAVTKAQRPSFDGHIKDLSAHLARVDASPKTFEEAGIPDLPELP